MASLIKVTLVKSTSNCDPRQLATVKGLGLRKRARARS